LEALVGLKEPKVDQGIRKRLEQAITDLTFCEPLRPHRPIHVAVGLLRGLRQQKVRHQALDGCTQCYLLLFSLVCSRDRRKLMPCYQIGHSGDERTRLLTAGAAIKCSITRVI